MTPLVVMVAPNGARRTKADHANLPLTPAEIAREAELCCAAGATVLHLHVRGVEDRHSLDPRLYRAAIDAVRGALGDRIAIQITTETAGRYGPSDQMTVVRQLHPEAVSLALAELVPDDAAAGDAAAFLNWLRRERIAPQYILYTPNDVARFHALHRRGVIPQRRPFALFVLGRYVETAAPTQPRPRDVLPYLKAHDAACPWAVCAFGPSECACVLTAAGLGGHARVGFENNLWLVDGSLASSNADLVAQVAAGARLLGRPLADIATTRAFLAETAL
jgi:3-keto-5-aminohexanoate cleavage enzyme